MSILKTLAIHHMEQTVLDPALRRKLLPNYTIGCKRILISNDYYPALIQKNLEVITAGIEKIRSHSIVDQEGRERSVDAIILGTGFQVADTPYARHFRGRDKRALSDIWKGSPRSHLGTTVVGFPNFFLLLGPNTGLGHNSVVLMIESQIEHILNTIQFMQTNQKTTVEPRPEAEALYDQEVQSRMKNTVWVTGACSSWYLDSSGKNSTLWPSSVSSFKRRVAPFNPEEYYLT
jgi:cation diffusion facilitator CzcD-associated flavoprotein CzcO